MRFARATFHQCWNSLGDDDFKMVISQSLRPTTRRAQVLMTPRSLCNYLLRHLSFCAIVSNFSPSVDVFSHIMPFWRPTVLLSKQHDGENTTKTKTTRRRQNPHDGDTMHTMQAKSTHRETILRVCVKLSPSAEIQVGSP